MKVIPRRWLNVSLPAAVMLAALAGCAEQPEPAPKSTYPPEFLQRNWEAQEVPVAHVVRRDYRLRAGDFLEIIYHVRHKRTDAYRIKIQDIISIRFPFDTDLNQTEQVQSDGTLHLDLVGSIPVFDKTIDEVHKILLAEYGKHLKSLVDPDGKPVKSGLTVSFKESNFKIRELKQAITTAPRGQSRLVPIAPDGRISLPFIVDVPAAGLTISELHRALNDAYKDAKLDELEVTVNVQTVAPIRVYVLGEVNRPGAHLNRTGTTAACGQITLLQAIAQAGGSISPRAELSQVMLIRRRNLPRPQAAIINVFQLLENRAKSAGKPVVADDSKHRFDIWLEDGDLVYVPTSAIAKRADYIDYVWTRGIRAVGGFTSSATANYNAADAVDWLGPNP